MDRRHFITQSCTACLAIAAGATLTEWFESCKAPAYIYTTQVENKMLKLPKTIFAQDKYRVIHAKELEHGLFVIKQTDGSIKAFSMRCTHKNAELKVAGTQMHCPEHGSLFDFEGAVTKGPAKKPLDEYLVQADGDNYTIKV